VKRCTDALRDDMRSYGRDGNADGISFETKDLLYRYVMEYRLLPLETEWAKRYLSFLSYRENVRALELRK